MKCDMCGKEGRLFKTVIEDAQLAVCDQCTKFGKVIHEIKPDPTYDAQRTHIEPEIMHLVVDNFAQQIKDKRETLGLTQEEFAQKINIKSSRIHQLESGHMKPTANLANKLKKAFGLNLIEEYKESKEDDGEEPVSSEEDSSYTLGDFIKIKKKT